MNPLHASILLEVFYEDSFDKSRTKLAFLFALYAVENLKPSQEVCIKHCSVQRPLINYQLNDR